MKPFPEGTRDRDEILFIIQAVVNGKTHFLDFAYGFMHDGRVLR